MPEVSVIIPSYNHAAFLRECLDSIFAQTFQDFEIILIDDGSTDGSVELAQQIAIQDPRLTVHVNEQNLGTYGTQARGLEMAQSPYVAIMNSDDLWEPTKLQKQVDLLHRYPDKPLCYVLGWMVDQTGIPITDNDVHADWPTTEVQDPLPYLLYENRILASGVLWRKEAVRFETTCRYSGDWVALLEAALQSPVLCISERLTFWRQHENNSYLVSPKQAQEEIRVREAIRSQLSDVSFGRENAAPIEQGLAQNLLNLSALYAYFYDMPRVRKALQECLAIHPRKQQILKRLLGTLLPIEKFRQHVFPAPNPEAHPEQFRQMLSEIEPLHIRR